MKKWLEVAVYNYCNGMFCYNSIIDQLLMPGPAIVVQVLNAIYPDHLAKHYLCFNTAY